MSKKKSVRKKISSRTKHTLSYPFLSTRIFIFVVGSTLGIVLITFFVNNIINFPTFRTESITASQELVLGDDEQNQEELAKEEEKAAEEQKHAAEQMREQERKEAEKAESQGSSVPEGSILMQAQSEGNKREPEIETSSGQKIKTKVEDDGTTKVEIEDDDIKLKYEVVNGKLVGTAEQEDGEDLDLDEDKLEELENEIEDQLEAEGIKITTGAGLLTFSKNQISATTNFPLSIDVGSNELIVMTPAGRKVVTVLPDEAVQNLLATGVINELANDTLLTGMLPDEEGSIKGVVEFTLRNDEPVYEVSGIKKYNLFAFIPVERPVTAVVSSENGKTVATETSFLTNVVDFFSP